MRIDTSKMIGQRINPPDTPRRRRPAPATEDEVRRTLELHAELGNEWRAIARRIFREFGVDRDPQTMRNRVERSRA